MLKAIDILLREMATQPLNKEYVNVNLYDNILINPSLLGEKLMNISEMSDIDVYNFVSTHYISILNYIFSNNDKSKNMRIFMNEKFLQNLNKVVSQFDINTIQKAQCNKIIFEALRYEKYKTESRKELLTELAIKLNIENYNILIGLKIPKFIAVLLMTSRYYTKDSWVNVKYFNEVITLCNPPLLNEQQLVDIYSRMFEHVTPLFIGIMFDTERLEHMTSVEKEVDSLISLVVLDLLESMTSNDIKTILLEFTRIYHELKLQIRFSLTNLSNDYSRIVAVVNQLSCEGIYVP